MSCEIYKNLSLDDMIGGIWKDVPGYEGLYQVSNLGRIKSFQHEKSIILKQVLNNRGYLICSLSKKNKIMTTGVHKIVALAFLRKPKDKEQVNHKNMDKCDNRLINLEYVTQSENRAHAEANRIIQGRAKQKVYQYNLNKILICIYDSIAEARTKNDIAKTTLLDCLNRKNNIHKGFIWSKTPLV